MTPTRVLPSHAVKNHTSEIELHVQARSLGDLLAETGRALAGVELTGADCLPGGHPRPIRISASDRAALLAAWLDELIFLAEVDRWIAVDFTVELADDTEVRAHVSGVVLEYAPSRVKAATLRNLRIINVPGGLETHIILDVRSRSR
jgi:SHS2 domain-containing protein